MLVESIYINGNALNVVNSFRQIYIQQTMLNSILICQDVSNVIRGLMVYQIKKNSYYYFVKHIFQKLIIREKFYIR